MLLNGKELAKSIRHEVKKEIELKGIRPGLAIILVGNRVDSSTYVRMKKKACLEVGIRNIDICLDENVSQEKLIEEVIKLNNDNSVHAILIQLPLPKHIDSRFVLNQVKPEKDVDGFHVNNVGRLTLNQNSNVPCTPAGIIKLLDFYNIEIEGKNAVIVGRSNIVGIPISLLLLHRNATVTICHSRTKDLKSHTLKADILIAACGRPSIITKEMVKPGVVIVDVGINSIPDATRKRGYRLVGDVDYENVKEIASHITPVPGGVGPMTIAMLLKQTLRNY